VKPPVGGQAVIEGVMMQNGDRIAVAVRRQSDGGIVVRPLPSRSRFKRLERIPFVRGTFRLYDMLSLGIRALDLSSKIAFPEDEQLSKGGTFLTFLAAIVLAILVEGMIRLAFFLTYLMLISRMKEIHRVFQYHGAEHKTVHAYEADEELTVENARRHTTLHPRCGTAFLMIVVVVAILVFSVAGNPALWLKILSRRRRGLV